jgi:hypothetical protein
MYACIAEGAGIVVVTLAVAGSRFADVAVIVALPSSALVVSDTRIEIVPAGIMTVGFRTDTTLGVSDESVTIVADEDTAGSPFDVARPTSNAA